VLLSFFFDSPLDNLCFFLRIHLISVSAEHKNGMRLAAYGMRLKTASSVRHAVESKRDFHVNPCDFTPLWQKK
jgi:hypothetical protein